MAFHDEAKFISQHEPVNKKNGVGEREKERGKLSFAANGQFKKRGPSLTEVENSETGFH